MDHLNAEFRDQTLKAKQLRKTGLIPATIYGGNLEEALLIQIPLADVNRLLTTKAKGNALTLGVGGKEYHVLFKELSREVVSRQAEHLEFQCLVADEAINSVAQIIVINADKNENFIQQHIEEIPHNALPSHLVEKIIIDLEGLEAGATVKVEDLEIAQDENIRVLIPEDTMIINVVDRSKTIVTEEEEETEGEEGEDADAEEASEE